MRRTEPGMAAWPTRCAACGTISFHWIATLFLLVLLAAATDPSRAQEVSPLPSRPTIDLPVGQGRILRFDEPVESVLIADTTIADVQVVSPNIVYVFGLKPGLTNLIAVTAAQKIEATAEFRVRADPRPAREAKQRLQPAGTIDLSFFGDRIVLSGHARSVQEAVDVDNVARAYSPPQQPPINGSTVAGSQQVNIRVRFAEVSRTELASFGVDWHAFVTNGDFTFGLFKTGDATDGNLGISALSDSLDIEILLDVLQRNGVVKILAEPNLTAVTGQTASFLAGGEIPVPVPQSSDTVTVEYKRFGVSLDFTPTVLGSNRIALHVQPEVSAISDSGTSLSAEGFNLPSFVVRRADTTVEVASGQTFAIAGLFQQRLARNLQKLPVLGDLPILGALFQSQRYQREETELVILITPYLVKPVSHHRLATPLDRPAASRPALKRASDPSSVGLIIK